MLATTSSSEFLMIALYWSSWETSSGMPVAEPSKRLHSMVTLTGFSSTLGSITSDVSPSGGEGGPIWKITYFESVSCYNGIL